MSQDTVSVIGPDNCSFQVFVCGKIYEADKNGVFCVPFDALEHLKVHGFSLVNEVSEENFSKDLKRGNVRKF